MAVYEVHFTFPDIDGHAIRFVECSRKALAIELALEDIFQFHYLNGDPILYSVKKYRDWPDTPNADMNMEGIIKYQKENSQVEAALKWLLEEIYNEQ